DIGEVMHVILAKVSELLKPSNWSLLLKDHATGELYFHAAVGEGSDRLLGLRLKPGEGIAGWVSQHNQPLLVPNVHADPRFASRFDKASRFHTKSILCVPLTFKDRTLGVIELVNGPRDGAFHEEDLRILGTVAEFSAIAIENARNFHKVQELTVLDDHTGLFNSRHMKRQLEQEVVRATRFGHPVSVIFFDLDYFKRVNDSHGHQAGSQVLHEIGRLLLKTLRSTDVPVRYGGDEFMIVMPETSKDQAVAAARRIGVPIDLHQKTFRKVALGSLDEREVRTWLDLVATQLEELVRKLNRQDEELRRREARINEFKDREQLLQQTLTTTQKVAEEMKANAR